MLVGDVVGQLELVEGDHLLHPLLPGGRAVWVDVHSLWHLGVRLPGNDPPTEKNIISRHSSAFEFMFGLTYRSFVSIIRLLAEFRRLSTISVQCPCG